MIIDKAVYADGRRRACGDLSDELDVVRSQDAGFIWIGLKDPTAEEFAGVSEELGLHPLAVEDAVKGNQRAKVEVYESSLFVVLKTLRYLDPTSDIETGELMLFVGDRFVVTVRRGEATPLAGVRHRLEERADMLALGPTSVLHAVMDAVVDTYVAIDAELARDIEQVEERVFSPERTDDAKHIYELKREVLECRRAAVPLVDPARRLAQGAVPHVPDVARPYFRDVLDHLVRVTEHIESYDRLLADILSAHLAQVSVRQNDDMRKISAWVAIAAVPTAVAGIYGMNFEHMPELRWTLGYPAALLLMLAVCSALFRAFKRSGWL